MNLRKGDTVRIRQSEHGDVVRIVNPNGI